MLEMLIRKTISGKPPAVYAYIDLLPLSYLYDDGCASNVAPFRLVLEGLCAALKL